MASDRERSRRIVDRLIELSSSKQLAWKEFSSCRYGVELAAGSVAIASEDGDDVAPFVFEIERDSGFVLDSLRTTPLSEATPLSRDDISKDNSRLRRLYNLARDQALGIGETLDELEHELGIPQSE